VPVVPDALTDTSADLLGMLQQFNIMFVRYLICKLRQVIYQMDV